MPSSLLGHRVERGVRFGELSLQALRARDLRRDDQRLRVVRRATARARRGSAARILRACRRSTGCRESRRKCGVVGGRWRAWEGLQAPARGTANRAGITRANGFIDVECRRRRAGFARGRARRRPRLSCEMRDPRRCLARRVQDSLRRRRVALRRRARRPQRASKRYRSRATSHRRRSSSRPAGTIVDAIDRTGRDAELAARAQRREHRVHALGGADDRVDRAGLAAQRAADAAAPRRCGRPSAARRAARAGSSATRGACRQRGERRDHAHRHREDSG